MKKLSGFIIFLLAAALIALSIYTASLTVLKGAENANVKTESIAKNTEQSTEKRLDVPGISQFPQLPTGCEATSAVMVLKYFGEKISIENFAESWLEKSDSFRMVDEVLYGADPNKTFLGDPSSNDGYGCYAPVIVNAVNQNSKLCKAEKVSGSLAELSETHIGNGNPLVIWATVSMKESSPGREWYLDDGTVFQWISSEHCLVLTGYNDEFYFLNDPQSGTTVCYEKQIVEKRFKELGSQAVLISKKN